jgi:hypothetical protein
MLDRSKMFTIGTQQTCARSQIVSVMFATADIFKNNGYGGS